MAPFITLAELAHRSAYAPAGPVGALRFTLVGEHWTCRLARALEAERLTAFRRLDGLGQAAALTLDGALALASAGVPLPPRLADLGWVRRDAGSPDPADGEIYATPWLALKPRAATRIEPQQLTLFPALRRTFRRGAPRRRVA